MVWSCLIVGRKVLFIWGHLWEWAVHPLNRAYYYLYCLYNPLQLLSDIFVFVIYFLPMVPGGGAVGQHTDFFSSFTLLAVLFLLGTENSNFQTGLTFQATPVTPIFSCSFSFYFLEHFCLENCPLLSGELSTPVWRTVHRLQAVQWLLFLFSTIQPWAGYKTGSDLAHK